MKKDELKPLTERQADAYEFIKYFIKVHGYSPSVREIARGIYVSKPVAQKHLMSLVEKGYVSYTPRTARSIIIKNIS